ncbi:MAG TPA: hypothetical protein VJR23_13085 [Candidatus Acidoferrales bacterium]|nr:hypothetical protein [Candidatus Acidoferrales bacterium]
MDDSCKNAATELSQCYSVFGLTLRSKIPIPGLDSLEIESSERQPSAPIVSIHLGGIRKSSLTFDSEGRELYYATPWIAPNGHPSLRIWREAGGAIFHLVYFDGMQFWIDQHGNNVWCCWPEGSSIEEAATYLLGPVLGLLLRLRGTTCLHASAVVVGARAIAFVGPPGAGKSTTAAAMARRGCPVLSDDIVALWETDSGFQILPAYPHLSLWPEPAQALYGTREAVPRFIPHWEKRCLAAGTQGMKFERRPQHLGAIFLLAERRSAAEFSAVPTETAFMSLLINTYATNALDSEMRAREFQVLSRLIQRVPIRELSAPQDLNRLDEVCDAIHANVTSGLPALAAKF